MVNIATAYNKRKAQKISFVLSDSLKTVIITYIKAK